VASRSPSCWRGCKPARPAAAGAGAARTEAKATARFRWLPGESLDDRPVPAQRDWNEPRDL
jgi:hypothetical protein